MVSKKLLVKDTEQYDKYKKDVENSDLLLGYIESSNLKKNTKITKITHLTLYCCSQDKYINDLLEEAKNEETSINELSDRKICQRLDDFEQYLKDAGYADKTVNDRVKTVRSFYRRENITVPPKDLRQLLNPELREEIKNSEVFKDFIKERKLTNESTIGGYLTSLTGYCDYYGMSIQELVEEAEQEEENNVRPKKRKIRKRLIEYRNYLYEQKFSNKTIKSKMTNLTFFFHSCDIDVPKLGRKENVPYDRSISFDEVPTKDHVKKAIETTTSIKNRALFLFCMTSCSGSAEAREFTIEEYIRGVKRIPENMEIDDINIDEVLDEVEKELNDALNNPQEQNETIIPVFHFVRKKRKRDYFTCITPEANQYIINYLKTREGLTLKDKVFDYTRKSLIRAFQSINDKHKWGWVNRNRQRFFTSHQLRRLGANLIEDERLVNEISGRKFDETTEAYFKRNKIKVRKEYYKWLDELTIYQKYRINYMSDERYAAFAEELKKEKEEKEQYKEKFEELEQQLENQSKQLEENSEVLTQIKNRTDKKYIHKTIKKYFRENRRNKLLEKSNTPDDLMRCIVIENLAYEYALEDGFDESEETINKYINKAIIQCNLHPELVDEMIENGTSYDREMTENRHINVLFDNFCEYLKTQGDIWEMIDDESKLKTIFFKYMNVSNYDVSEISADDMNKISEDVLMEYIQ